MIHWIASSYTSGNFCKKQAFLGKSLLNLAFFPTEEVKDQSTKWMGQISKQNPANLELMALKIFKKK
jgi:hypothetical protein